ncbi:hypothetical protein [Achromobacter sp. AGC39]
MQLTAVATPRDREQALAMHFGTTEEGLIYFTHHLKGKRYVARPGTPGAAQAGAATSTALDQTYRVTVQDSQASADAMRLLSPVAFVAGTGFVLANPAVVLLALPVAGLEP